MFHFSLGGAGRADAPTSDPPTSGGTDFSAPAPGASTAAAPHFGASARMLQAMNPPRLCYLSAAPLVHKAGGQARELDLQDGAHIDITQEVALLKRTLRDVQRRIIFRAEVATVKSFRKLLTIGCRMLHYTGIGKPSCLIFEKEKPVGETNIVGVDTLMELFAAGGVRTQLVFVNACHSEEVGRAFLASGVRHVVTMQWESSLSDRAASVFTEFFYLSLVTGRTVRQAFEVATTAALTETGSVRDEQFLLMPADGEHDVCIFADTEPGDFVDETPPAILNTCDRPPMPFIGRNVVVQEVVNLLSLTSQGNRCITIRGRPGVGKTALASRVCQYIAERNLFDAIYFVPLQRRDSRTSDKDALCKAMGSAIGFEDASNEREIVFLLQDKHLSSRVILVLDGADRFMGRASGGSLVQVLSYLLSRLHGLHLLVTAEGSVLSSGSGRLENSPEKVIQLGPLSDLAAAQLLLSVAPPGFKLEDLAARPYASREEAYADLAVSPVVKELRGHPKAIVMLAPLLEEQRLDNLMEKAKACHAEASRGQHESNESQGGDGGAGDKGQGAGGLQGPAVELDPASLEREAEEARRYLRDPNCQRIWLEVVRQGGVRAAGMYQGVAWYRLTDALQEELRKTLVEATRLLRINVGAQPSVQDSSIQRDQPQDQLLAPPPPPPPQHQVSQQQQSGGTGRPGGAGAATVPLPGESDVIRALEPSDVQFIKEKLAVKPSCDLVRITDFAVFCEGWVPALNSIRLLCREWLCNEPRLLHGLLSRKQTESILEGKKDGTLLFRFSTSHLGLLSLSFVSKAVEDDGRCVVFVEPERQRHASLQELVMSSSSLVEFYPGVPKAEAFKQLQRFL